MGTTCCVHNLNFCTRIRCLLQSVCFRYVLTQIIPDPSLTNYLKFSSADVYHAIIDTIATMYGDYGVGACRQSLVVKVFNEDTNILVIRISRLNSFMLLSSMPFVMKLAKSPAMLQTLHVGGSIRSCEKVLIRYHRSKIIASLKKAKNDDEKRKILDIFRRTTANLRMDRSAKK